jgi:signal transduction histidine kinase/CheY-like chemotaxis protein
MAQSDDAINVTNAYFNPANTEKVISFVRGVQIDDGTGDIQTMALLRIVPSSAFEQIWDFPSVYDGTQVELINEEGKYISNTKLTGYNNFYEYIKSFNGLSDDEAEQLKEKVNSTDSGYAFYNLAEDEQMLVVHSKMNTGSDDWILIAYIPLEYMESARFNALPLIFLLITVLILFVVNVCYLFEVNKQLKSSIEATQRANEAKTRFLSTMSHDIRTPMNAIIGMTAIAEKNINNPMHVESCLKKINLSSNHLLTLINDILDISKIESGKYAINPIVFSLSDLMENIFNIVRQNIRAKDLSLEIHTHGIVYEYLYADQLRLNQIYINIITNAVKYTNPGGYIKVDITQSPSPVAENSVRLVYRVEDSGIGMSKEFMSRMYESFARESDGRIDVVQGTGLGLAITKQLVDLMQGTIEVESEMNKGSVFTVTLDLPIAEHMTENLMLPDISMIVIDDDDVFLDSTKESLKQIGIDADLANSGIKGMNMIRKRHREMSDYQVVILDWKIPDMSGLEITEAIRTEIGEDIPIIIVSAYDYTEIEDEALAAGVSGFISKPMFNSALCKTIRELFKMEEESGNNSVVKRYDISGFNILIAEDNDVNYEIAECLLEDEGAVCTRAENGKICVEMLENDKEKHFDLVLMDMQMPVMKGIEATRMIRTSTNDYIKNIPVIAMTADAFAENIAECKAAGMDGHIAKPIDMTIVLREISRVMKKRKK